MVPAFVSRFGADPVLVDAVLGVCRTGRDIPVSSGLGRLFDAVSALCGLCPVASFDGEAAMAVDHAAMSVAEPADPYPYPWNLCRNAVGLPEIDPRPLVLAMATDLIAGVSTGLVCARFQATVVAAFLSMTIEAARTAGLSRIAMSGGAFQNRFLLDRFTQGLAAAGLVPLSSSSVPMNDGGLALGQAWAVIGAAGIPNTARALP